MRWKGRDLSRYGELTDTIGDIVRNGTREDAEEFMRLYSAESRDPIGDIGYLAGYFDDATQATIYDWFKVEHPVFGTKTPTPGEAWKAGLARAHQERLT